jgi:hypothetical protein
VHIKQVPLKDIFNIRKLKLIRIVQPYTMIGYRRLSKLYDKAAYLERKQINGSFVECGVHNGGSAGIISSVAKDNGKRNVWLLDSWEGLPEPAESDVSYTGVVGKGGMCLGHEEKVEELLFKNLKLDDRKIYLVKGWFKETIPLCKSDIGSIALLHLDCDWYESVKFCLDELYDNVVKNGFIFIDDYGHWEGCRRAVDEFLEERNLMVGLTKIDYTGVYFQK